MREALHSIDNTLERIPYTPTSSEISNLKNLAKKGIYICPYCNADLIVKSGEEREIHFAHKHSESCEEAKNVGRAETRYSKQVKRETQQHKVLTDIIYDELSTQSKIDERYEVDYGYRVNTGLKHYPDIIAKIDNNIFAISVVTNVIPLRDSGLVKEIAERHHYYIEQEMKPIWFVEVKELAIEPEKNAIVLWDAENIIAAKTEEDRKWDNFLSNHITDKSFFLPFNYPLNMNNIVIDVKSMYYIYTKDSKIKVKLQRFLTDRTSKPYRAFLLNNGVELEFSKTLQLQRSFTVNNSDTEENKRQEFLTNYENLKQDHEEKQRKEQEEAEERKRLQVERLIKNKTATLEPEEELSYQQLQKLLKEKINLTQKEQNELWNRYMPRIGYKNSAVVWKLTVDNRCVSFDDLRRVLKEFIN
ncbi:competence protein CoiA family protein [Radiobacillus sp. PE A8.2]|uniref:competence protein CoiA family protein n=1 Tax=Radiobacillus sp. PE A8.2 TaxID=3380349 RepID=UPI00388D9D91